MSVRSFARLAAGILAPAWLLFSALPAQAEVNFRSITSPQGLEAWFVEDYTVPIVTLAFSFEGGSSQDPQDKLGLAALMTTLFDEGAGDLDSEAFQIRADEVGLEMGFGASQDDISGFARMLSDEREGATELLALAVQSPRFDPPALERMRSQSIAGLVSRSRDPNYAAGQMWNRALFGDHPYGRPVEGTPDTLAAIGAEDLQSLHRSVFTRASLKIGIVGALDEKTAGEMIDAVFAALPEAGDVQPVTDATLTFGQDLAVDYPLPQTRLNLAYPGVPETDPDFFAAYVMTELLAGSNLLSRLNVEVREKRGLTYGVSGGLVTLKHADALTIGTATNPENVDQALDVIKSTIADMAENGPDPSELERVKHYLIGAYAINQLGSSVSIAGAMVGQQVRGLPLDYVTERESLISAVTAEDVQAVASRLFGEEPSLMLVGPGAQADEISSAQP
ncbi:M16 family metallopeptidase [Devosia chinhatensis]|uniref:Uncharacterized protein n=1 Tax=Devosia chinhatensis TaxID=429727 RepID=A0A0F5FNA5_9HYPH|nr:pitrilysin family protein [Devosia chinhatensis]KKB10025.1 hypothetical protein VE26_09545 [Devosia chinhatensis]